MSSKAMTCVLDHSPYSLGRRLVHLACAWSAGEDDLYLYASQATIGRRAKVARPTVNAAMIEMVNDGWLIPKEWDDVPVAVQARVNDKRVGIYLVPLCEKCGALWVELPSMCSIPDTSPDATCSIDESDVFDSSTRRVRSANRDCLSIRVNKSDNNGGDAAYLCEYLSRGIKHHFGKEPKQSAAWGRDMDRLLRLGPTSWATPEAIAKEEIHRVITALYTKLADRGTSQFCWADQIRSPGNLRKHWDQLLRLIDAPAPGHRIGNRAGGAVSNDQLLRIIQEAESKGETA